MTSSIKCNAPDVFKIGANPDKWNYGQCLLDFVSVFSEKDLIALGVNQQCAHSVGFLYAKEVASLPTPFVQNAFLYFFWFVDRHIHNFRPHTVPRSKLRCQLMFLAARKTCQHASHSSAPTVADVTPTPRVRTSSSMRKKIVTKSPSLPEMADLSPDIVVIPQPAESEDAEVNSVVESREVQVKTPVAVVATEPVPAVEPEAPAISTKDMKNKKRNHVEIRAQNASSESSGSATPKRKTKIKSASVSEKQKKQEALETGIRVQELVRQYVPYGEKKVTSSELLSLVTMQDPVGNYAACELISRANLCDEHRCKENSVDFPPELMQGLEIIATCNENDFPAEMPEEIASDARATIEVFKSCPKPGCPLKLFVTMLQRLK